MPAMSDLNMLQRRFEYHKLTKTKPTLLAGIQSNALILIKASSSYCNAVWWYIPKIYLKGGLDEFYTKEHKCYCGVDLHARSLYVCIIDQKGEIVKHKNIDATPEAFLKIIKDYREDVVVAVECMFAWYGIADLCREEGISFVLGHALYMKAIHDWLAARPALSADRSIGLHKAVQHVLPLPRSWN